LAQLVLVEFLHLQLQMDPEVLDQFLFLDLLLDQKELLKSHQLVEVVEVDMEMILIQYKLVSLVDLVVVELVAMLLVNPEELELQVKEIQEDLH
jgi:hypothetical protein